LFENAIANRLERHISAPGSKLAPELKSYVLAFPDGERLVESVRESWRVALIERLVKQSETFEQIVALKPRKWADLGRELLASNFPAYSRAVFNSLKGLRKLSNLEEKLRIEAMVRSWDDRGGFEGSYMKRVGAACREYSLRYGTDEDIRLWSASVLSPNDKPADVLDLLAPLGPIPKSHPDEVFRLRIEALSVLGNVPSARLEALNWVQYDKASLDALMELGMCETRLEGGMRLQAILDVVTALSKNRMSLNQADYVELRMVEEFLDEAANEIAASASSSLSVAEKVELSRSLQRLVQWLEMEMADRSDLAVRFIEIGETLDPASPAFTWMGVRERSRHPPLLWLKDQQEPGTNQATSILNLHPDAFPPEFRYRIVDAQRRLANAAPDKNTAAAKALSPSTSPDPETSSAIENDEPWRQAQIYDHPREMVFNFGYELYSSPSARAAKIRSVTQKTSVNIAGEIVADGVRFFLTDWSLQRFREEHKDGSYLKPIESGASISDPSSDLKILPNVQEITFVHGYQVFEGPSKGSRLLKPNEKGSCRIAAYLDTAEGRFYLSDYSLDRHRKGLTKFWILELKP
jgi:hypothetical protein